MLFLMSVEVESCNSEINRIYTYRPQPVVSYHFKSYTPQRFHIREQS